MMSNNHNFPHFSGNQGQANPPRFSRDSHNHMKSNLYSQAINLHPNENFSPPHNESFASSNYSSQSGRAKKKIFEPLGPPEQINLSSRSEINHQPSLSLHQTRSTPQNNAQNLYQDMFQNTQPLSSKLPQPSPRGHNHNLSIPNYYSERPEMQQNYGNQNPYLNQNNLHPQMIYENRSTTPTRSPIRNKHAPQDLNINVPPSPNSQFQNQNHLPPSPHSQFNNLNYPQKSPHAQHNKNFIPEEDFHSTRPQPQPHSQGQAHSFNPNQQLPDNNYVNAVDFDGMSMISGTSSRRRTKPIVILNINVGNGQTDELKLFDGENPEDIVNSFCMKYKLPTHIQPVLLQNLSLQASRFYEVRAKKQQQRMLNRTQPNILEEDQSLMTQANNLQSQRAQTETAVDYYSGERQQPGGYRNERKNSYVDMNEPQPQRSNRQQQQPITPRGQGQGGQGFHSNQGVVPPSDRNRERNASRSPIGHQDNQYQQYEEPQQQYREPKQQQQYKGPQQQQYREPQQQQKQYREPQQQQQSYREPPQQSYREPPQQSYREPPQQQQSYREPKPQQQRSQRNLQNPKQETKSWNQLDESEIDGNDYEDRSQASSTPSTQVFDKLYEQGMKNKERKELMRDDLQRQMNSKEVKELTFQPQINKNTRAIIPKRKSKIEDELWKDAEQRRERQAKAQLLKEKLEMEGFTGTPKINTGKRPTQQTQQRATQSKSPVHSHSRFDDNPPPARKPERVKNPAIENNNNKFVPTINRKSNMMAEKNRNNNMTQDNIHNNLYEDGLRKRKSINQIDERPSFDPKTNQEFFKPKINKSNPYYQKAANKRDSTFVVEEIAVDQDQLDEAIATRSTRSIRPSYNQNRESKSVGPLPSSGKKSTAPKAMSKQNISKDDSFSHYDERDNYHEEMHPPYIQPNSSSNKKIKEEELSVGSFHSNKKASIFVSEPEREKLIEIFQALDDNHDGIITVQDIDVSNLDPNVIEAISDVLFALEGVSMMTFDDFAKAVYDMKVIVALREIYGLPPAENPYQSNKMVFSPEKGILKTSQPEYKDELSDYLFAEKDTAPESRDPRASELDSRDNRGTSRSPNRKTQKSVVFADSDSDSKGLTKRYQALVDKSFSGKK